MAAAAVRSSPIPGLPSASNKRKRGTEELGRNVKVTNSMSDQDTNYAALLQGIDSAAGDDSTRTAQAALAGAMDNVGYPEPSFDGSGMNAGFGDNAAQNFSDPSYETPGQTPQKAVVGTPQWHQQRKENHKEGRSQAVPAITKLISSAVERRRREVINEGIENIAKIVPGTEKNKGAILGRTAQYIQELQDQVAKFPTERQTYDITIKELTKRIDQSKDSLKQAWTESNKWQQRCRDAGLQFDDYDGSAPDFDALGTDDLELGS